MDRKKYIEKPTRRKRTDYEVFRRAANRIIRKKKRRYLNIILKSEEDFRKNNLREAYKGINFFKKGFQPKSNLCKAQNGELLTEKERIMERWKEYFQEHLNPNSQECPTESRLEGNNDDDSVGISTIEDTYKALNKPNNNKAPGIDNLPGELLKYGGEYLVSTLHQLLVKIWVNEELSAEWQTSVICPKKGDKLVCENYRGISLLSTA